MAKPTIRTKEKKSSAKGSQVSFRAIKRQAKARAAAPKILVGREARTEERFRELVAWYMLQGADEVTARRRARVGGVR
jgi:hypothetical protein